MSQDVQSHHLVKVNSIFFRFIQYESFCNKCEKNSLLCDMQYMSHGGHIYGQRGGAIFYVDTSWGPPGIKKGKAVTGD